MVVATERKGRSDRAVEYTPTQGQADGCLAADQQDGRSVPNSPRTVRDKAAEPANRLDAVRGRTWRPRAETGVFFLLYYLYVSLVIDPRLIHHTLGILVSYHALSFSTGWDFFRPFLARPGGLVEYAARFLSPFFSFGWVGALIVTALAWITCLGVDLLNRVAGRPRGMVLRYVPAVLLLVLFGSYSHPLQIILSLLVGLGGFRLYLRLAPGDAARTTAVLLVICLFAYYVAGAGSLLFSALVAIDSILIRRRTLVGMTALLFGLALPWLVGSTLFHLSFRRAYADYFLVPDAEVVLWNWRYALALYLYFPGLLAGAALRRAMLVRKPADSNHPASSAAGSPRTEKGFRFLWRGEPRWSMKFAAVCLGAGAIARLMLHTDGMLAFQADYYCQHEMWQEALEAADKMPERAYDSRYSRNVMLALYHTGRLGDEMFRYPQAPGVTQYDMLEGKDSHTYFQESRFFLELGLVNEAEKCAHEAFALEGDMPAILQHLAVINIVKDQPETASVFLNALSRKPFHQRAAEEMLRRLDEDPRLESDPRVRQIRRSMTSEDRAFLIVNYEASLLRLLEKNPDNKMAFEFLMAHYLCVARPDKVVENVPQLRRFGYSRIPRHFQEAILLDAISRGKPPATGGQSLDAESLADAGTFFDILKSTPNRDRALDKAVAAGLGDSYFFYYRFGVSGL